MFRPTGQTTSMLLLGVLEAGREFVCGIPVEHLYSYLQISVLRIPVVDQLVGLLHRCSRCDDDVVATKHVGQHGVDGCHPAVEVPMQGIPLHTGLLQVDDVVRQANAGWIQQSRVDLEH